MTTSADTRARVLCCTAQPHPGSMTALKEHAPQAEVIDVAGDEFAYWREIRRRWTGEADLVIIEQDIEIGPDTIRSLEECDQPWCCYAYPIFRRQIRLRVGLGCTKISAAAQRMVSAREIAEGFELCATCKGQGCWWHLDGRITQLLKHRGLSPHVHGDVTHHHDYHAMDGVTAEWGVPVEIYDENPAGGYSISYPAVKIANELPDFEPACNPRQARHTASELARLGEQLAAGVNPADITWDVIVPRQAVPAFVTDKVQQGYLPTYHYIADQLGPSARICEVGVLAGGSLATWQELFPQGTVAGVDNDPDARWPEGTRKIVMNQDDPGLPAALDAWEAEWDLIVDDASHDGRLTAATLDLLWPLVSPGGYYVIEDWFTGFADYRGACKSPEMLTLVQSLLERMHWNTDTESVSYRYGMAIIRKKA
jgi:hypothetical protein